MVFFADNLCVREANMEALSRSAQYIANFEPLTLLAALSSVTSHIGLVATASTSYNEPFHVARKFASIDHISGGRAGWNLVTSGMLGEANNFSRDVHYEHGERYHRAREFAQVVNVVGDVRDVCHALLSGSRLRQKRAIVLQPFYPMHYAFAALLPAMRPNTAPEVSPVPSG